MDDTEKTIWELEGDNLIIRLIHGYWDNTCIFLINSIDDRERLSEWLKNKLPLIQVTLRFWEFDDFPFTAQVKCGKDRNNTSYPKIDPIYPTYLPRDWTGGHDNELNYIEKLDVFTKVYNLPNKKVNIANGDYKIETYKERLLNDE